MVSRLLGERQNLDRVQIDQKMRSISGEQTLSAVYNTAIIYSGFQIRAPFSPFNSHPKHMLWVLKRTVSMRRSIRAPKTHFDIGLRKKICCGYKKNHLIETVLLSTLEDTCLILARKIIPNLNYAYKIIRTMDYSGTLEA